MLKTIKKNNCYHIFVIFNRVQIHFLSQETNQEKKKFSKKKVVLIGAP